MTVSSVNTKVSYSADGSTRTWALPSGVNFPSDDTVKVILGDEDGEGTELYAGYSVDLDARTVTYPSDTEADALEEGEIITIARIVPYTQDLDSSSAPYSRTSLEAQLDKIVMQIQQIRDSSIFIEKTQWLSGAGVPDASEGYEGDVYLDSDTGDIYQKISQVWTYLDNIIGPKGDKGDFADTLTNNLNVNNYDVINTKRITFNGEIDNGNSGSTKTIDLSAGAKQKITLTDDCTVTFSNTLCGHYLLKIVQDTTGGWTLAFPSGKWVGGAVYEPTPEASAVDFLSVYYDGATFWYSVVGLDLS